MMNKEYFITNDDYEVDTKGNVSWFDFYNSHDLPLEPLSGLLNVKGTFSLNKKAAKITASATALGVFRLYINGSRVGRTVEGKTVYDELKPGWTDYRLRVMEYTYDITALCEENNTVVADIAPGWWNGRISIGTYGNKPCAFAAEITVLYEDGTSETVATDETWEVMVGGPTKRADIWDGQYDDFRLPHPAKNPGFYF